MFETEETRGIALMCALSSPQRERATIAPQVPREVFAGQFRDNLVLPYEGIGYDELIIATDEEREGESIGWHLVEAPALARWGRRRAAPPAAAARVARGAPAA